MSVDFDEAPQEAPKDGGSLFPPLGSRLVNDNLSAASMRKLSKVIKRLNISRPCILAVKDGSELAVPLVLDRIAEMMNQSGIVGFVIVVDDFDNLAVVDEATLNKAGWYYVPTLSKVIHAEKEEENASR